MGMEEGIVEREEDLGVLGQIIVPPAAMAGQPTETVPQADTEAAPGTEVEPDEARRSQFSRMAANMVVHDEPRGSYFVNRPGL